MSETVIAVKKLKKSYDGLIAVQDVSLDIQKGEIFGILGPNGAGKTTILECLEGLRLPDGGDIRIMGIDPVRNMRGLHNIIGVQLQSSGLDANMTVREAIRFFSAYHNVAPRYDLLDRLGLKDKANSQYYTLSTGLQRRLALALALAHRPPIVIMDEPTAGLDVQSRVELHAIMNELKVSGITILLATHDMAEAEKMTDRVAILLRGGIISTGTPRELTAAGSSLTKVTIKTEKNSLLSPELAMPGVQHQVVQEDYLVLLSVNVALTLKAVLAYIEERQDTIVDLRVERPSLEERFLEITTGGAK
jgi:ABC-2 type transport system ATP-binding protein